VCVRSTRFRPCPNYTAPGGYLLLERLLVGLVVRHLKRLDRPIVSTVKRPLTANRLQRWGRGARKHDVHLMDDALEAWAIVLAALCSDRHFSACSSFAKLQGEPIQLGLRRLSPGEDAEVHNEASILSEHDWKVGLFRHKGLFPASGREVTPHLGHMDRSGRSAATKTAGGFAYRWTNWSASASDRVRQFASGILSD